uniref:Intraflagellar transport protein 140 n=1 Tax=Echinococcus granulosus TaxID=6210 RepID=A0A068WV57_ECHGR|nr:intraflagellar transport protein 140 [Echinococcus granulosus]
MTPEPQRIHLSSTEKQISSVELIEKTSAKDGSPSLLSSHPRNSVPTRRSLDSAIFLGGCCDGRIIRVAGEVALMGHNLETTTERLSVLAQCNAPVVKILANYKHRILLVITEENMLIEYRFNDEYCRDVAELLTLKLASQLNDRPCFVWAGEMILAMALGESVIRVWDITKSDNYTLSPHPNSDLRQRSSIVIERLAYCPKHKLLATGMSDGRIAIWKYTDTRPLLSTSTVGIDQYGHFPKVIESVSGSFEPESCWLPQPIVDLFMNHAEEHLRDSCTNTSIGVLVWDSTTGVLAASYGSSTDPATENLEEEENKASIYSAFILRQQPLCANIGGGGSAVVQVSSQRLAVISSNPTHFVKSEAPDLASVRTALSSNATTSSSFAKSIEFTESVACVEEQLRSAFCTQEHVAVWNGRQLQVYKHNYSQSLAPFSTFACDFEFVGMYEQSIVTREARQIHIRNLQGTVKQLINFAEADGPVVVTSISNGFMACLSETGVLKVFDLTKKEAKQMYLSKALSSNLPAIADVCDAGQSGMRVAWLSINSNASAVAFILTAVSDSQPDSRIFVWQLASDRVQVFDLSTGEGRSLDDTTAADALNKDHLEGQECKSKTLSNVAQMTSEFVRGHYPLRHYWDLYDSRLLVVEAAKLVPATCPTTSGTVDTPAALDSGGSGESSDEAIETTNESLRPPRHQHSRISSTFDSEACGFNRTRTLQNIVVAFFVNPEHNSMIVQEVFHLDTGYNGLIGVEVPYFYFILKPDLVSRDAVNLQIRPQFTQTTSQYLGRRVMREFSGLETADPLTRDAILNFSFFLAHGEIDAAFKSMRLIRSTAVWENMAKMCVITRRLDVGFLCLGKIGNAFGASMLREFRNGDNCLTAQTGELALQLGMTAEAERLFIECGRWDLVTRMHRALGHWDEALSVVEKHNRVRLKNTHYAYALELKNQGNIEDAIHHFVQSNTHCVEVPRMLKDFPEKLEEFVNSHPSRELHHWWAQSLEAKGRLKEAELYYSRVKDYVSLVRVYCCGGKEEAALELCNETGDAAACYHLARQMEAKGDVDRAIQLYTRARAFSCAVRLAKEHNRNENLYSLAQLGSPDDMLDAARHLEQRGNFVEKAVLLYHRAGHLNTAINLAFEKRQYGALVSITCDDLGSDCDPELIRKCSNFFLQNDQFVKAVEVLARGKQWLEAVKLCTDYDVALSEDLAEQLTPPPDIDMSETERRDVLTRLGYACLSQGLCHLACKKLTQAGDRVSAMKALLRSGDTNKIIFFANVSKQRDIYIMAANYLQTLGTWRNDTSVVKLIVQFYTRAKSFNSLSSFYEACAQMEVDEYQSYEKAMGALTEAYKALSRAVADAAVASDEVNGQKLEERLCSIKSQIMLCKKFVDAQLLFEDDPVDALSQCQAIVDEPKTAIIIRPGHVYAVMVKGLVAHEQYHAAYACLQEMKEKLGGHEAVARYLDKEVQNAIFRALDMPMPVQLDSRGGSDSDRGLTMGEECMESIEDNADMALESDCEYGQDDSA